MSTNTLSPAQGITLVAEREILAKVRSKSFIISTIILLVIVLGGVIWAGFQANSTSAIPIAVTAETASALPASDAVEITEVTSREAAETLVSDGEVDAALIADSSSPTGVTVIAKSSPPEALIAMLSVAPSVELLDPDAASWGARYLLGLVFGMVFMMAALNFGSPIATSVIEEKQTRIIEILLSAISARVLLAGKVIGSALLALGQILLVVVTAVIGLVVTNQTEFLQNLGLPMVWFAVYFVFGFLLIAALFAAAGSLVSRQEDAGSVYAPIMIIVMAPMYLVMFLGDNPLVMTILSYVPFTSPVAMPVKLFFNEAAWYEPIISLLLLIATASAIVVVGAKTYSNALLKMGARVKLADALRGRD